MSIEKNDHHDDEPITNAPNESNEQLKELLAITRGPCKKPIGSYISLNGIQRSQLSSEGNQVKVGSMVQVRDAQSGEVIGVFTVGLGRKGQSKHECYINGINPQREIRILPLLPEENESQVFTLNIEHGLEKDAKHPRRSQIIGNRFTEEDKQTYISIPTTLAIALGLKEGSRPTVRVISKITVKIGEKEQIIVAVPTGNTFGMTNKASELLSELENFEKVSFIVRDGKLVLL